MRDPDEEVDTYPVRLQVFGYAGNGILDPIDFNAGTLVSSLTYSGEHQVTLDVTSFINNLRATEAGFARLQLSGARCRAEYLGRVHRVHGAGEPFSVAVPRTTSLPRW